MMLTGALILLMGLIIGYLLGRAMNRAKKLGIKPAKEPKPICGCTHHYSMHNRDGTCHGKVYLGEDRDYISHYEQCTCQRYTGPEPLPLMIAGE
jgi:hypothetical protein